MGRRGLRRRKPPDRQRESRISSPLSVSFARMPAQTPAQTPRCLVCVPLAHSPLRNNLLRQLWSCSKITWIGAAATKSTPWTRRACATCSSAAWFVPGLLIGRLCCLLALLGSLARATHLLSSLSVSFTVFSQNMVHFGARTRNGCGVSYLIMRNMPKKSEKKPAMRDLILMSFFLGELMSRDSVDNDRLGIVIIEDFTGAALMQSQMYSSDEVRAWGGRGVLWGFFFAVPSFHPTPTPTPPPPPPLLPSPHCVLCSLSFRFLQLAATDEGDDALPRLHSWSHPRDLGAECAVVRSATDGNGAPVHEEEADGQGGCHGHQGAAREIRHCRQFGGRAGRFVAAGLVVVV